MSGRGRGRSAVFGADQLTFGRISGLELHLDSRFGVTTAPIELLVDADMELPGYGLPGWAPQGGGAATISKQSGGRPGSPGVQVLKVVANIPAAYAWQPSLIFGRNYRIRGWTRGDGIGYPVVQTIGTTIWTGTSSTDWQYYDETFTADSTVLSLYTFGLNRATFWDDMSLTGIQVATWGDQAKSNHAYQTVALYQPTFDTAGINGLPSIRFDGSFTFLRIVGFAAGFTEGEAFVVGQLDADPPPSGTQTGLWFCHDNNSIHTECPATDGVIYDAFGSTTRKTTVNPAQSLASPFIYNVSSKAGKWTSRLNGVQIFTTGTNVVQFTRNGEPNYPMCLGSSFLGVKYLDGLLSKKLFYNRVLKANERSLVEAELKSLYGIA